MKITIKKRKLKKISAMVAILAGIFVVFFANSEDNTEVETMSAPVVVLETNMGNIEVL